MLQQELWELKDMADLTQQTFRKINTLLDDDLNMDKEFRRQHPEYLGHNVEAVQTKYRQALQNYQQLMETASNSDAQLLQRLEELPMDTKFKLITKSKSQLDCLLPATAPKGKTRDAVDVTPLSQSLAALSDSRLVTLSNSSSSSFCSLSLSLSSSCCRCCFSNK